MSRKKAIDQITRFNKLMFQIKMLRSINHLVVAALAASESVNFNLIVEKGTTAYIFILICI